MAVLSLLGTGPRIRMRWLISADFGWAVVLG